MTKTYTVGEAIRIFGRDCTVTRIDESVQVATANDGSRVYVRKVRGVGRWSNWLSSKNFPHVAKL